jgi:hypothetical protein
MKSFPLLVKLEKVCGKYSQAPCGIHKAQQVWELKDKIVTVYSGSQDSETPRAGRLKELQKDKNLQH